MISVCRRILDNPRRRDRPWSVVSVHNDLDDAVEQAVMLHRQTGFTYGIVLGRSTECPEILVMNGQVLPSDEARSWFEEMCSWN